MTTEEKLSFQSVLEAFSNDFSNQRLDSVIEYFSDHAEYRELGGKVIVGKANIRQALRRVFEGAYGKLTFIPKHILINEDDREVCFVWMCQHNLIDKPGLSRTNKLIFTLLKLWYGKRFHWEGVDYFIFDDQGKIVSKQTYGKSQMPRFISGVFDY
ncbi:nuclear transport factor 2 family protein [Litoribrevibacter euphylliae]|uniref:Nuclear transport factor 2 family protein n=1 Tax=Litoribrevibacter euphylliae TaxID=1834034 RepID=A0ABV7HKA4_9GAMM